MRDRLYVDVEGEYCGKQRLLAPWGDDPEFLRYAELARDSLVTTDRLWVLYSLAKQGKALPGAFFECGVYKGGTLRMLAAISGRPTFGIDTFEGLPEPDPEHDRHVKGVFSDADFDAINATRPWNVNLIRKDIRDLDLGGEVSLAHIDVDLYASVKAACEKFYPLMVTRGIMVFDDYGGYQEPGAADAVDEFFAPLPEFPLYLPTGQAIVFKL